jgi:hypothetical protein
VALFVYDQVRVREALESLIQPSWTPLPNTISGFGKDYRWMCGVDPVTLVADVPFHRIAEDHGYRFRIWRPNGKL